MIINEVLKILEMGVYQTNVSSNLPDNFSVQHLETQIKKDVFLSDNYTYEYISVSGDIVSIFFTENISDETTTYITENIIDTHFVPEKPQNTDPNSLLLNIFLERSINSQELYRGSIVNTSGLTFTATGIEYVINDNCYRIGNSSITLSTADETYDRIDLICANELSQLVQISGTPSIDPATPTIPIDNVKLLSVTVNASSSEPSATYSYLYNHENEWTITDNSDNLDVNDTSLILSGTKSIKIENPVTNNTITIANNEPITIKSYDSIVIRLQLTQPAVVSNIVKCNLVGYNEDKLISNPINIFNPSFGFNPSLSGAIQNINIPVNDMGIKTNKLDTFKFIFVGVANSTLSFHIDQIYLQNGIPNNSTTLNNDIINLDSVSNLSNLSKNYISYTFCDRWGPYLYRSGNSGWSSLASIYFPGTNNISGENVGIVVISQQSTGGNDDYMQWRVIDYTNDDNVISQSSANNYTSKTRWSMPALSNLPDESAAWELEWRETDQYGSPDSHGRSIYLYSITIEIS